VHACALDLCTRTLLGGTRRHGQTPDPSGEIVAPTCCSADLAVTRVALPHRPLPAFPANGIDIGARILTTLTEDPIMRMTPYSVAALATVMVVVSAHAADFGAPIRGLTADQLARFNEGKDAFEETEVAEDGLGPVFNGTSCVQCHSLGGTGGASDLVETRFGTMTDGAFDHMTYFGGSLIQTDGIGVAGTCDFVGEIVPPEATVVAGRRTTSLFGLGLVDAVPDGYFVALSRLQARYQRETAGHPNVVTSVSTGKSQVGKFGWKGQVANLFDFSGDAYLNEMGITTPMFPNESCPQGDCDMVAACDPVPGVDDDLEDVELFRDFMSFLAPPPRAPSASWSAYDGSRLFDAIGCANCHVRQLTTGPSAVKALAFRTFAPYSDFLLHDMGTLGDGIVQSKASGRDMRTAPLWGVRLLTVLMHDGRAHSLQEAILAHDGQGRGAKLRFTALSAHKQQALLDFLKTL
jgi:CxxC motif-containing protein (DUF1111 family)